MTSPLLLCARQERVLAVRSRWTQIFALVFAALSLAVAGAGYILTGGSGLQEFSRTAVSLVQLVLFVVPLTSLLIGVMALVPDRGAGELLFSQPISRGTILLGKVLGIFQALVAAQAIGFGAAGLVIFAGTGGEGIARFLLVCLGSVAATAVFLAIAALLSAGATGRRRARTLAVALVVWFGVAVIFDLAALGIATLLPSGAASRVLIVGVIVNPVDALRTGVLLALQGTAAFGAASLAFLRFTNGSVGAGLALGASVLVWIIVPLILAVVRLRRADV